jgi:hypothetical protein
MHKPPLRTFLFFHRLFYYPQITDLKMNTRRFSTSVGLWVLAFFAVIVLGGCKDKTPGAELIGTSWRFVSAQQGEILLAMRQEIANELAAAERGDTLPGDHGHSHAPEALKAELDAFDADAQTPVTQNFRLTFVNDTLLGIYTPQGDMSYTWRYPEIIDSEVPSNIMKIVRSTPDTLEIHAYVKDEIMAQYKLVPAPVQ